MSWIMLFVLCVRILSERLSAANALSNFGADSLLRANLANFSAKTVAKESAKMKIKCNCFAVFFHEEAKAKESKTKKL